MKIEKKDLEKSQVEIRVELPYAEFEPYIKRGAEQISKEVKIEGFRPGKAPFEIVKRKVGEMSVLEEAARIVINDNLEKIFKQNLKEDPLGEPKIEITKLAPNNPLEFKIVIFVFPNVELGEYKDLKIKNKEVKVEEKEIKKVLTDLQESRAKEIISEKEVKDGDKILIDINLSVNKVPLEGGQSKDLSLIVGKEYIVPGFDKKIAGAKKGEERVFSLPYPENFHMKNLAGKMVDFDIKIKEIYSRELPELNDEFAKGLGQKNLEELKLSVEKAIKGEKEKEVLLAQEREMLEKIVNKTKYGALPEILVNQEVENMLHELKHGVEQQGGKFEDYLSSIKKTAGQLKLEMAPEAVKRIKTTLAIREIGKKEKIKADIKEVDKYIEEIKKYNQSNIKINPKEKEQILKNLDSQNYKDYVYSALTSKKIVDQLMEWNII